MPKLDQDCLDYSFQSEHHWPPRMFSPLVDKNKLEEVEYLKIIHLSGKMQTHTNLTIINMIDGS